MAKFLDMLSGVSRIAYIIFVLIVLTAVIFHIMLWYNLDTTSSQFALQQKLLIGSGISVITASVLAIFTMSKLGDSKSDSGLMKKILNKDEKEEKEESDETKLLKGGFYPIKM